MQAQNLNIHNKVKLHKRVEKLMGNIFEISVMSESTDFGYKCLYDAINEIKRIEKIFTTFDENSQTNKINQHAGIAPVKVEQEVIDLIERSIKISNLTQGAFDITYGSSDKNFWNFDLTMKSLPDKALAKAAVRLINYKNIVIDKKNQTVFLKEKGMRIGFGGIGKGYAAERVKALLKLKGIHSGIVNAAGDLTTWGFQADGKPYSIGIANPSASDHPLATMNISNMAVATSGNYEKYVMINGIRYSHTIDPKTGYPITGIKSVTIICPNAEVADSLATPVMIMGIEAGLHLINQMKGVECLIIDEGNQIFCSQNIKAI
jgi:thiamine biosynthesis lipoprotein